MDVITTRELKERLDSLQGQEVTLLGWIRNHRKQKNMGFMDFFDGTCFKNPQVVYDNTLPDFEAVQALRVGSAVKVTDAISWYLPRKNDGIWFFFVCVTSISMRISSIQR